LEKKREGFYTPSSRLRETKIKLVIPKKQGIEFTDTNIGVLNL